LPGHRFECEVQIPWTEFAGSARGLGELCQSQSIPFLVGPLSLRDTARDDR
jgi:hypothetical protein